MIRINVDARALQDENYATKGIGQHTIFVASLLRGIGGAVVGAVTDPLVKLMRREHESAFDLGSFWLDRLEGDVFLNPSPLTHDSAPFVAAARRGMRTGAIIHDFIPLRQRTLQGEEWHYYQYLLGTLNNYDFLVANSDFTETEIRTFLPDYTGAITTLHCRSRFVRDAPPPPSVQPGERQALRQLRGLRYAFVATADDPRKNPELAIQAAAALRSIGLRLVVGGGLTERTRRHLMTAFPDQAFLAEPIFLPRLTDGELVQVYQNAELVIVPSRDEGFSLPIAEAIALGVPVIASRIPAHAEQILHGSLLFEPDRAAELIAAARFALDIGDQPSVDGAYRWFDHAREAADFQALVTAAPSSRASTGRHDPQARGIIVGPAFDKPTGIATYDRLLMDECRKRGLAVDYVDVDDLDSERFHAWLLRHQFRDIIYVIGNNNVFHTRCFTALLNIPGECVLHDSRMFEFLLNRYGPHKIVEMWARHHPSKPIDVATVVDWQRDRRLLPYSFLDHITSRARTIVVHNKVLASHLTSVYGFARAVFVPFALQMTDEEITFVAAEREVRAGRRQQRVLLAMLGETEATKACAEIIYALKILLIQGYDVGLAFVGKSEDPYHSELTEVCARLDLEDRVTFLRYVPRATYLDCLVCAQIVIQLRYPLFGQVSGPLADAVACAVPAVTTEDLAQGMGFDEVVRVVPNSFSPLHIAEAVRNLIDTVPDRPAASWEAMTMSRYVTELMRALASGPLATEE